MIQKTLGKVNEDVRTLEAHVRTMDVLVAEVRGGNPRPEGPNPKTQSRNPDPRPLILLPNLSLRRSPRAPRDSRHGSFWP